MKKILVLDDDKGILIIMDILLKRSGFDVCTVAEWESVISDICSFRPDLVILDFFLGRGKTGEEICKEIKSTQEIKHIPVLIFSASSKNHAYADGFIEKPFEMSEMLSKINILINSKSQN